MEHEKQIADVKKALDLEQEIQEEEDRLMNLDQEAFEPKPTPPVHQTAVKKTVPVNSEVTLDMKTTILLYVFTTAIGFAIYYFYYYKPKRDADIERILASDEYKNACAAAETEFEETQKQFDEEYAAAMDEYENVTMPDYNAEKDAWEQEHNDSIAAAEKRLAELQQELADHYEETKIVPSQYRYVRALAYIYEMISTSDFTVTQAVDYYERHEQQKIDMARLDEQQQSNDLLDRQNGIAESARKQARNAAAVGIAQRHNTNKQLKHMRK